MARGFGGGMPPNMNQLMKQAQKMQKQMEEAQAALAEKEIEVTAGGGVITITITGKKEIKDIKIDPEVVDPEDVEMLQDLLTSAINEALRQVEEMSNAEMGRLMPGGMPGGLF
ncbi:MAG: YbaB/EbfC family nucleoid-associated protein [Defluviitaleaceae bacterium]|nr:YbaB/EbfC family nucleoid-associated protein [Defluviitaleaceae bacterium]